MLFRQFYQMKGMGGMFYFSTRSKGMDSLGASADLASGWRMRYVMVKAFNFLVGMGWRQLRGGDRRPAVGFSVQDVRKLEEVERGALEKGNRECGIGGGFGFGGGQR